MAKTVQVLGRSYLPGQGFNLSGSPKQGKAMIWGQINVSSYPTGGESIVPNDLGLTTIDHAEFFPFAAAALGVTPTAYTAGNAPGVNYRKSANLLEVFSDATTEQTSTNALSISFFAVGDSARDVESLS